MADKLSQSGRVAEFSTPLGKDALVLTNFKGSEGLGELFEFQVEALSDEKNVDYDKLLGHPSTIKMSAYKDTKRHFNGIVTEARSVGMVNDKYRHRFVMRPWLHLLGHASDSRIFRDKSVKDTIKEVFTKAGFNDFEFRTTESYEKIRYCVQYRETHLAFVHRLMEQHGIYYFFEHSDSKHTLVLADSRSSHQPVPDLAKVPFRLTSGTEMRAEQHLHLWHSARKFCTGKVTSNDYDYEQSKKNLLAPVEASTSYGNSKMGLYLYPGKYSTQDQGKKFARVQLEAEQALDNRRHIRGDAASLYPGGLTTVQDHPTDSENQEYLMVRSSHQFESQHYRTVEQPAEGASPDEQARPDVASDPGQQPYSGSYEAQPSSQPFRMKATTQKPRIYGVQTGLVCAQQGEDGEEISTDSLGRVMVKFFWDTDQGQMSCWARVAQVWAGKQWGGMFIPRVGMEVVIEFEEGDPDHPVVVGCVYKDDNSPPYDLPANKTMAGVKSNSSKGGDGYNEFVFEDKKGSENIRMHAEKDYNLTIKETETRDIGEAYDDPNAATRTTTLHMGSDLLMIQTGHQNIRLSLGKQTVDAAQGIMLTVAMGASFIQITPASITLNSPTINIVAQAAFNVTSPATIFSGPVAIQPGPLTATGVVNPPPP